MLATSVKRDKNARSNRAFSFASRMINHAHIAGLHFRQSTSRFARRRPLCSANFVTASPRSINPEAFSLSRFTNRRQNFFRNRRAVRIRRDFNERVELLFGFTHPILFDE